MKPPGREVDSPTPSDGEVKNEWSYASPLNVFVASKAMKTSQNNKVPSFVLY
jgi:hypothetical protein